MNDRSYKPFLIELLARNTLSDYSEQVAKYISALSSAELAYVFVDMSFLVSAIKFVDEERWIQQKDSLKEVSFGKFVKKILTAELAPVLFLHEFFEHSSIEGIKQASVNCSEIEKLVINTIKTKTSADKKNFSVTALKLMSELFEFEHQLNLKKHELGLNVGLSLYRTFDRLDEVFNLDYLADQGMVSSLTGTERLYEGAGVGVQSSYSNALIALRYLNPAKGSRFVDLGSGYGRIGLVVGLMRPDIQFMGYEFVDHRVTLAAAASVDLGISQHVHFRTQDLSLVDFQIPVADAYYIYDAFSESTYQHVLAQLVQISQKKKITVVTKGNARQWLQGAGQKGNWSQPQQFDNGNLCFFRS